MVYHQRVNIVLRRAGRCTHLRSVLAIALHLEALTKIHQALVDFAGLSERCSSGLGIPRTLRPYRDQY